jgi:hypothetical protein
MYIDYGNQEKISDNRLWQLTPEFSQMPVQAFCCALARVSCHYELEIRKVDNQMWLGNKLYLRNRK